MQFICLANLAQQIFVCVSKSCQIMGRFSSNPLIKFKDGDDPVTQIDHTIQKFLMDQITRKFPNISIVGEEEVQSSMVDDSFLLFDMQEKIILPSEFVEESDFDLELKDICLFIDPLDGTRGLVSGKKWQCTVLVGVTYKGTPIAGVIGQPFKQTHGSSYIFQPTVTIGGSFLKQKCAIQCQIKGSQVSWEKFDLKNRKKALKKRGAVSSRRTNEKSDKILKELNLNKVICGGSGNKLRKLIVQDVDFVMFLESPTSTWDSCAGEAIIKSMGGHFFKPDLTTIEYNMYNQSQLNPEGFIACFDTQIIEGIVKILEKSR